MWRPGRAARRVTVPRKLRLYRGSRSPGFLVHLALDLGDLCVGGTERVGAGQLAHFGLVVEPTELLQPVGRLLGGERPVEWPARGQGGGGDWLRRFPIFKGDEELVG